MDVRQQPTVAVLIDCWDLDRPMDEGDLTLSSQMYQNIVLELDNWPGLKYVIISPNGGKLHETISKHQWLCDHIVTDDWERFVDIVTNAVPDVVNIVMMGKTWDLCLVNRPLGWMSLKELADRFDLPKFRILTVDKCTLDKRIDDPKSISKWTDLENASRCELVQDQIYEIVRY